MELLLIIAGIWLLYSRTWLGKRRHHHIIDDNVRRWGYLYEVPITSPPVSFYSSQPHPWRHFFLILTHSLNVWVIHMLFGWQVAAMFAFSPLSVNGTAWITGGYYAVTMFLSLTSYYFIISYPGVFGLFVGSVFFTAALGSTITCIGIPFVLILMGYWPGAILFWPLAMYLFGKRFQTGYNIRNQGKKDSFSPIKLIVMTKVMAYYIRVMLWPDKLAFFREFGRRYRTNDKEQKDMEATNSMFWSSLLLTLTFIVVGWQFSPLGVIWFIATLAPFTQFKILGQFVAERYLYLPQLGIFLILGSALSSHPIALAVVITAYIYRSHLYIPAFRKIESLYKNGITNFPDCVSNVANLGERYLHIGQIHRARRLLEEGLRMEPNGFLCSTNLAAYWISVKGYKQALYYTENALRSGDGSFAKRVLHRQRADLIRAIKNNDALKEKKNVVKDTPDEPKENSVAKGPAMPVHALPKQSTISRGAQAKDEVHAKGSPDNKPVQV